MHWTRTTSLVAVIVSLCSAASAQTTTQNTLYVPEVAGSSLLQTVQYPGARYDRDAFRHRSYWDRRRGRGYFNRNYGRYERDDGAAIAAGFLGFVLGAAIAGSANDRSYAQSHLGERGWVAECSRRYRSFDPRSGTYLGYDGYRHYCQL